MKKIHKTFLFLIIIFAIFNFCSNQQTNDLIQEKIRDDLPNLLTKIKEIEISENIKNLNQENNYLSEFKQSLQRKLIINVLAKDKNLGLKLFKFIKNFKNKDLIYKSAVIKSIDYGQTNVQSLKKLINDELIKETIEIEILKKTVQDNLGKAKKILKNIKNIVLRIEGLIYVSAIEIKKDYENGLNLINEAIDLNENLKGDIYFKNQLLMLSILVNNNIDKSRELFSKIKLEKIKYNSELINNYFPFYLRIDKDNAINFLKKLSQKRRFEIINHSFIELFNYNQETTIELIKEFSIEEYKINLFLKTLRTIINKFSYNYLLERGYIQDFGKTLKNQISIKKYYIYVAQYIANKDLDMALSIIMAINEEDKSIEEGIYFIALEKLINENINKTFERINNFETLDIKLFSLIKFARYFSGENENYVRKALIESNDLIQNLNKNDIIQQNLYQYFVVNTIEIDYNRAINALTQIINNTIYDDTIVQIIDKIYTKSPEKAYLLIDSINDNMKKGQAYSKIIDLI